MSVSPSITILYITGFFFVGLAVIAACCGLYSCCIYNKKLKRHAFVEDGRNKVYVYNPALYKVVNNKLVSIRKASKLIRTDTIPLQLDNV